MKLQNVTQLVYKFFVGGIAVGLLTILCLFNLTSTTYLIEWEKTVFVGDRGIISVLCMSALLFLVINFKKLYAREQLEIYLENEGNFKKVRNILLFGVFFVSFIWIISSQYIPGVDEGEIHRYIHLAITEHNFDIFKVGEYMNRYPSNWGLFLYEYTVALLVGTNNYIVFQIINAISVAVLYKQLSEIGGYIGLKQIGQLLIIVCGVLFFPTAMYAQMVYGNSLGTMFALLAVKYGMKYVRTLKLRDAAWCAIAISLAVFVKNTVLIYTIAILASGLAMMIYKKEKKIFLLLILIILGYFVQLEGCKVAIESLSGYRMEQPTSSWSFVAMGLQDDGDLSPGWWNSYIVKSYEESNKNTKLQEEISKQAIEKSIHKFKSSIEYTLEFFTKKITSTWANPSFQSFVIVREGSNIEPPIWVRAVLSYRGQNILYTYLNSIVFVLYFGALLSLVFGFGEGDFSDYLTLPMAMIGGFLFLLFWETKARYALLFVIVIIPYAVDGYGKTAQLIENIISGKKEIVKRKICIEKIFPLIVVIGRMYEKK